MDEMARLHSEFPDDDEVTTFYAVSLLSGARALEDETFRLEVKAGALAMDVFERNRNHPGAAHYIIHSFDDPIHAPLALEAADAFADIAPAVSHAIHMPTHIYIQHGMWEKVSSQNMRAHQVASELWKEGDSMGDMSHSLDWGQYGFLQKGDYAKAAENVRRFEEMVKMSAKGRASSGFALAKARYIVETEEWKVQDLRRRRVGRGGPRERNERGAPGRPEDRGEDGEAAGGQSFRFDQIRFRRRRTRRPRRRPSASVGGRSIDEGHATGAGRARRSRAREEEGRRRAPPEGGQPRGNDASAERRR